MDSTLTEKAYQRWVAVGISICAVVVRTRIRGVASEMAEIVTCVLALVVACAVGAEKTYTTVVMATSMIIGSHDHTIGGRRGTAMAIDQMADSAHSYMGEVSCNRRS